MLTFNIMPIESIWNTFPLGNVTDLFGTIFNDLNCNILNSDLFLISPNVYIILQEKCFQRLFLKSVFFCETRK